MLTCFIGSRGHAKQLFEWILIAGLACSHTTASLCYDIDQKFKTHFLIQMKTYQHLEFKVSHSSAYLLCTILLSIYSPRVLILSSSAWFPIAFRRYTFCIVDAYFYADPRCRRACCRLTHHAKQRAARLNLKIDTRKAANLSIKETYSRYDPEIVQTYSAIIESLGATGNSVFKWPMSTLCWPLTRITTYDRLMHSALIRHNLPRFTSIWSADILDSKSLSTLRGDRR